MSTSPSPSLFLPLPSSPATPSSPSVPAPTPTPTPPRTTVAPPPTNSPTTPPVTTTPTTAPTSPTTAATSSTSTTSSTTSTPQIVPTSSGTPPTITSFVAVSTTPTPTSAPQNHATSNSFFSNKGAVAGVFTVVGLVVVALIVALVVNAIRRRRAQKFDRDVAEAAAEAAMSSRSPFDDYSDPNNGGHGSSGYGYSENTHGTYQQPPLQSNNNNYGMSEMARYDPYPAVPPTLAAAAIGRAGGRNETSSVPAGIAGVGAGNLAREPSKRAPYHAFAGPGPQPNDLRSNTMRSRRGDVLEAAGLADTGSATMAGNNYNNEAFLARKPSEYTQNTHHSGLSQGHGSMAAHPAMLQPGYPIDSYYPQRNDTRSPESFVGYQPAQSALYNPHDATLPSPSLPGHQSDHTFGDNEEYHGGSPTALRSDEQRMSYQDDADYSQGNRVLRVANE